MVKDISKFYLAVDKIQYSFPNHNVAICSNSFIFSQFDKVDLQAAIHHFPTTHLCNNTVNVFINKSITHTTAILTS
jgi:hypothetical protein